MRGLGGCAKIGKKFRALLQFFFSVIAIATLSANPRVLFSQVKRHLLFFGWIRQTEWRRTEARNNNRLPPRVERPEPEANTWFYRNNMAATIDARVQEAGLPMASEAPQLDEVVTAMARYAAVSIVGSSLEAAARPPAGPGTTEWEACAAEFEGAVVFCDISGFTGLTERLAQSDDGYAVAVLF